MIMSYQLIVKKTAIILNYTLLYQDSLSKQNAKGLKEKGSNYYEYVNQPKILF